MRFAERTFITVGRTSHKREEASDSSVREMGDVVHMTSAVSSKAVIPDIWHTLFWSQPRVTGAMNMMSSKADNRPGKFRSLESQSNAYEKVKSEGTKFKPDEHRVARACGVNSAFRMSDLEP